MKEEDCLDLCREIDHKAMIEAIELLFNKYKCLKFSNLCESIMGRSIPIITIGEGKKELLYVGAHHGMERITSALLIRFIEDFSDLYENKRNAYKINLDYIFRTRSIHIIPMLNPDGVEYSVNGIGESNVIRDRLISMNGGSEDFSHWQANARGVDLNHNYNCGFAEYKQIEAENAIYGGAPTRYSGEHPESEPESASLANYIRFNQNINLVLTLHAQGEEIYYTSGDKTAKRSLSIGREIEKLTGYKLSRPEGMAAYGGLTDWVIDELSIPSFTLECGKGENPLPYTDVKSIYRQTREAFFTLPTLI